MNVGGSTIYARLVPLYSMLARIEHPFSAADCHIPVTSYLPKFQHTCNHVRHAPTTAEAAYIRDTLLHGYESHGAMAPLQYLEACHWTIS